MSDRLSLNHGREIRADLVCTHCTRSAGWVQGPNVRQVTSMSLRAQDPEYTDAVLRLRCPHCSGRLWLQNVEEVHADQRPLTAEELRPRHGRRQKPGRPT
jgi:hypothetical protein